MQNINIDCRHKLTVLVLAVAVTSASPRVIAQLEEVIVTAEKREQSIQDVPISIVAMSRDKLDAMGISSLEDISANVPNFVINPFNNDPNTVRLFIRGIGQNDVQITQDPSVALYLDGVYVGTSFGTGFEGVDIERIEILRGPQGTLYGRNATGGAVNIITQRADTEALAFRQSFTFGNLNKLTSKTTLNVPLSDKLAAKASYLISKRDGYVENDGPGVDLGEEDRESLVIDLRFEPNDVLTFDYRYENGEINDSQRLEQITELVSGNFLGDCCTVHGDWSPDRLDNITSALAIEKSHVDIKAHTFIVGWDMSDSLQFKSITAYREMDSESHHNVLATSVGDYTIIGQGVGAIFDAIFITEFKQFSQEFQLLGDTDTLQYTLGLYYYDDEGTQDGTQTISLGVSGATDMTTIDNDSVAIFGQATWTPASLQQWHFTVGARYSKDKRSAYRVNDRSAIPFSGPYKNDFSNFNPSLTVAYDIADDANIYGKVVSGYKSGGTSTRSANAELFAEGFDEEDILSYELGFKANFWERRARLNAAVFYMELDGLQTSFQTGFTPGDRDFLPIDDNKITGFEMDLTVRLAESWTANISYGYLDTEVGAKSVTVDTALGPQLTELSDVFSFAPENSLSVSLDYHHPVANGNITGRLAYSYQDKSSTSLNIADETIIDDYRLVDASLGWNNIKLGSLDGTFRVMLWGKNLTDEEYALINTRAWAYVNATEVTTFGDPRTYGVTLAYDY